MAVTRHPTYSTGSYVIQAAAAALQRWGNQVAPSLAEVAEALPDPWARYFAVDVLAAVGDRVGLAPILRLTTDANSNVRKRALTAAGAFGDPVACEPLLTALASDDRVDREAAAIGLGCLRDTRAVLPLRQALNDPEEGVVAEVAYALARCGDRHSLEAIAALLRRPAATVAHRAAQALGELGDPRACPALVAVLGEHYSDARTIAAAEALRDMSCHGVVEALIALLSTDRAANRVWACRALGGATGDDAKAALLAALDHDDMTGEATDALLRIGDDSVTPSLAAAIGRGRLTAGRAYGWLISWGLEEAEPGLITHIHRMGREGKRELELFLGCGNPRLAQAALDVARDYRIYPRPSTKIRWGARFAGEREEGDAGGGQ